MPYFPALLTETINNYEKVAGEDLNALFFGSTVLRSA